MSERRYVARGSKMGQKGEKSKWRFEAEERHDRTEKDREKGRVEGSQEVKKESKERPNKGQMEIAGGQTLKDGELGGSVLSRVTCHRG